MRNLDIIYFSSIDWDYTWQRPQQLASRLAARGRVLFVNPFGLRNVLWKDWERFFHRVYRRVASAKIKRLYPSLTLYSPLVYAPMPGEPGTARLNGFLMRRHIRRWLIRNKIQSPIYWAGVPSPAIAHALAKLPEGVRVYDCLDDFACFHAGNRLIRQTESDLVSRAALAFAASHELHQRLRQINANTFLLPNAADCAHFNGANRNSQPPEILARIPSPILGYIGEIAAWIDFDLLYSLAAVHPEWQLVFIGPVHTDIPARVLKCPNIHWLGRKPYAELPALAQHFDVCLLPFLVNRLTAAVNPVKLYEYLAMGKPVVSTPLSEILRLDGLVYAAASAAFADAVRLALETETKAKSEDRRQFATMNTWDMRVDEIVHRLSGINP